MIFSLPLYLLKVSLASAIFFAFYLIFLKNKTFFQANRFYLLYTSLLSFGIPFLKAPPANVALVSRSPVYHFLAQPVNDQIWAWQYERFIPIQEKTILYSVSLGDLFVLLYVTGLLFFGFLLIRKFHWLFQVIRNSEKINIGKQTTWFHPKMPISSFFSYLFWNKQESENSPLLLEHEKVHMRQWHSSDIILLELLKIILWFNPIMNKILWEIRLLHEYIADDLVVRNSQIRETYLSLLEQHHINRAPTLVHHFHSFIKNRLFMLHRKRSSNYHYSYFLLFIPVLFGMGILLMSPGEGSLLSTAERQWQEFKGKKIVSFQLDTEKPATGAYLAWGAHRILFPVSTLPQGPLQIYEDLDIEEFRQMLREKVRLVDPHHTGPVTEQRYFLNCQTFWDRGVPNFHTREDGHDNWESFVRFMAENIDAVSDGCRLYIDLTIGDRLYSCRLNIKDEATRKLYLNTLNESYHALDLRNSIYLLPSNFKNDWNEVSFREVIKILSVEKHTIFDHGKISECHDFDFYFINDLNKPLNRQKLITELNQDKSIKRGLVLRLRINENQEYLILFDDSEISPLIFPTWGDFFNQPIVIPVPHRVIEEQVHLDWNRLMVESPQEFERQGEFRINDDNSLQLSDFRHMLRSVPNLKINGGREDNFSVSFKYIDHQYLPFTCRLDYDHGKLVRGEEFIAALEDRLKPDDFISAFEISTQGRLLLKGSNIKIR